MAPKPVIPKVRGRPKKRAAVPGTGNTTSGRVEKPGRAPGPKKTPITGRFIPSNSKDRKYRSLKNTLLKTDKALEEKAEELNATRENLAITRLKKEQLQKANEALDKKVQESNKKVQEAASRLDTRNQIFKELEQRYKALKKYVYDFREWSEKFQDDPTKRIFGHGIPRYTKVKVLIVHWKLDDIGYIVQPLLDRLSMVFRDKYNYEVNRFQIPEQDPSLVLSEWISGFLDRSPETLLIFYYCGHGSIRSDQKGINWTGHPKGSSIEASSIQRLFEETESDALLLYESCYAATGRTNKSSKFHGATELIASCGFETVSYIGSLCFTTVLSDRLSSASEKGIPLTVSEIFNRVFSTLQSESYKGDTKVSTPIHCKLTSGSRRDIIIHPLEKDQRRALGTRTGQDEVTHPVIALNAESSFDHPEWLEWMRKAPPEAAEILKSLPWSSVEDISLPNINEDYATHPSSISEDSSTVDMSMEGILEGLGQIDVCGKRIKRKAESRERSRDKRHCLEFDN